MLLSKCRKPVDTFAPSLGRLYRSLRDATVRDASLPTKYGFTLAGDPTMAREDWEADEIEAFLDLMRSHDVVVDIGANVGMYTCLAASRGRHVIAFEPARRNLNFLYRNLWENQLSSVEVFPLGLGAQCGLARMYGYGGIASFVPGWAQARRAHSSIVPLTTLDTVLAGRLEGSKALIKMDVEGFELEVLAGAGKMLSLEPKPTWLVEILLNGEVIPGGTSPKFGRTFDLFWRYGYICRTLDASRKLVSREDVLRWLHDGRVDGDTHDFLFMAS